MSSLPWVRIDHTSQNKPKYGLAVATSHTCWYLCFENKSTYILTLKIVLHLGMKLYIYLESSFQYHMYKHKYLKRFMDNLKGY